MTCSNCHHPFTGLVSVTPNTQPSIGAALLCGECAHLSIVEQVDQLFPERGLTCRLMSEPEFLELDYETRRDLNFAIRNILAVQHRLLKGKKIVLPAWYDQDNLHSLNNASSNPS